jgi:hypothetical protein
MKKQRTRWIFLYKAGRGTYIRIGWIYNKKTGCRRDRIRIQIHSIFNNANMYMTVDEALVLISGLGKVLAVETNLHNIEVKGIR